MKIKNEVQVRDRLKYRLDAYIEADKLNRMRLDIDYEEDPDIVEFTEEELKEGNGYISLGICGVCPIDEKQIHITCVPFAASILKTACVVEPHDDETWVAQAHFYYKDYMFFDLMDKNEYEDYKNGKYRFN